MNASKFQLTTVILFVVISFFCTSNSTVKHSVTASPPGFTTLDSLQGTWIDDDDSLSKIIIADRMWNSKYSSQTTSVNSVYRIYFCDTAVTASEFSTANFDTTALSGNYIILRSQTDNSLDCAEMLGFVTLEGETFFSKRPAEYWTMSSTRTFKKIN